MSAICISNSFVNIVQAYSINPNIYQKLIFTINVLFEFNGYLFKILSYFTARLFLFLDLTFLRFFQINKGSRNIHVYLM